MLPSKGAYCCMLKMFSSNCRSPNRLTALCPEGDVVGGRVRLGSRLSAMQNAFGSPEGDYFDSIKRKCKRIFPNVNVCT
jgi:hypothetical protein